MLELPVWLGLIALAAVVIYLAAQPSYLFVVRVEAGMPRVERGKVTVGFQQRICEACDRNGVKYGWIGGIRRGKRIALVFSRQFSPGCQQQLRNEWSMSL